MKKKPSVNGKNEAQKEEFKDYVREQSKKMLKRLPALGPIVMLYMQSAHRRYQFVSDIEWLVLPPLIRDQCKLYMKKEYPISFISWAFLNEEAEKRLILNGGKLRNEDWNCGDRIWLIDLIAPFGGVEEMLKDMQKNQFPGKTLRLLVPDPKTGGVQTRELTPYKPEKTRTDKKVN